MYHVISNLELMFWSLDEAVDWANNRPEFQPRIPATAMCGEDLSTPRICGAAKLSDCITALGVTGTFRRCLNANSEAKSYENDSEAYPVLVAEFDDKLNWIKPSKNQVPDVAVTHERWLLQPARPAKIELKWLDAYSIRMRDAGLRMACTKIKFLDSTEGYSHPWLDGKGHPLDCPDMGDDPWPNTARSAQEICLDLRRGGHLGFAVPVWPLDGSWLFMPFEEDAEPYRTYPDSLRRFTGCRDMAGEPIFEGYAMKWNDPDGKQKIGDVRYDAHTGWYISPWDGHTPAPIPTDPSVLSNMRIYAGHGLNREIEIPAVFQNI